MSLKMSGGGETALKGPAWRPGSFALRDTWFPVAHAPQVAGAPIRRAVHGRPIFLWRTGDDKISAAEFHPSELQEKRPHASAFTDGGVYPALELFGHAWVWYGDPAHADPDLVPDIPFLPRHRAQPDYARDTNFFHCTYELVCENVLDLTHIDFVHGNFAGSFESEDDRITYESTSETVTMIRTVKKRKTSDYQKNVLGIKELYQDQQVFAHVFIRSGMCFLHSHYSAAPSMPLMQTNTPESRVLTRANAVFGVQQCDNEDYRRAWPLTGPMVAAQDETMLAPQNPRYLRDDGRGDLSSRFDAAGIQYRARYNDLVERQKRGDFSYLPDMAAGPDIAEVLHVKRVN